MFRLSSCFVREFYSIGLLSVDVVDTKNLRYCEGLFDLRLSCGHITGLARPSVCLSVRPLRTSNLNYKNNAEKIV